MDIDGGFPQAFTMMLFTAPRFKTFPQITLPTSVTRVVTFALPSQFSKGIHPLQGELASPFLLPLPPLALCSVKN